MANRQVRQRRRDFFVSRDSFLYHKCRWIESLGPGHCALPNYGLGNWAFGITKDQEPKLSIHLYRLLCRRERGEFRIERADENTGADEDGHPALVVRQPDRHAALAGFKDC